jgi:hypothetical protein
VSPLYSIFLFLKGDGEMATEKYVSLNNLSAFLDNIKETFSTKDNLDIIESLTLLNKAAIEANTSALEAMQTDIETLAAKIRANEENLENFIAISSQEINTLF